MIKVDLKNLTIRAKLFLGFSILLIIFVGTSVFVIDKLSESNTRLIRIVDGSAKRVNLSNEIRFHLFFDLIGYRLCGNRCRDIYLDHSKYNCSDLIKISWEWHC
ncbi:hypothetical protein CH362_07970 [Leptospira saintgironsiae]|uniref:Chemotaxis methyl-accepting receptor HlyB-like 4HB MCP domain-containing protein n=1 Tax=Leptospira saintgironsiae TaxID=2023183 RepID=A0A2M9YCI3_9LEPT|nr:hypothetical protein CH362_07970 [Leptospira saintgironsiae]